MAFDTQNGCGCDGGTCGRRRLSRRDFLKVTGLGTLAFGTAGLPVMAGPFENKNEYLKAIPRDKRLDPAWVRSLVERGTKETYSDPAALGHVGMPVGGLFAGTVYLSGDGRLWLWDVFNRDQEGIEPRRVTYKGRQIANRDGANYVEPAAVRSPFDIGFALRVEDEAPRPLDAGGFRSVTFDGRYPIARVAYRDADCPVEASLEAFSPFIPLSAADSSLPATVMHYHLRNTGNRAVSATVAGRLQNPVCCQTGGQTTGRLRNRVVREANLTTLACSAEPHESEAASDRPDILFEDFEKPTYDGWTAEGTAFGTGPVPMKDIPDYQGDVGGRGKRVVNSHAAAPGKSVSDKDSHTGTLTSRTFTIQRKHIAFLVGGGAHKAKTCVNLLTGGKVVASVTGRNDNRMQPAGFSVGKYQGREARIQVVDQERGGWGNIGIDHVVFTDRPPEARPLAEHRDFGTMALALLGKAEGDRASANRGADPVETAAAPLGGRLTGDLARTVQLQPGGEAEVTFLLTWHFPNLYARGLGGARVGRWYATRWASALAVARYLATDFDRLAGTTRRWVETWYDSTLPYWLLDRTMANTSTLATNTCYRFENGRFWGWEGIGCCPGTCTHVWHYAQAPGRLFPEIERDTRQRVDFGLALHANGGIGHRAYLTNAAHPAHDGQCGRILGAWREHQMTDDKAFLERNWPNIKKAVQYMIRQDGNADGMIEGAQPNTLDAAWYGKISFLASLYLAALRAGEAMATEMGDEAFAQTCRRIADRGAETILETFNGEYFIQIEDPAHANAIGIGPGCYIDQVFGQTWAHWVGLGRLFDRARQLSALRALWKYNFVPDVGPFREQFERGRWYAAAGDAGLLMCTWPRGGRNPNFQKHWQYMYFNECMTGFEWQAASHMLFEGRREPDLLQDGLAVARAIHDRYNARLRNPYNEIECSDHYARAMASYGAFLAVCGYEHHGPKGHLGFAPALRPENFQAAFTAAGAWGTFNQKRDADEQTAHVAARWGTMHLKTLALEVPDGKRVAEARATAGGKAIPAECRADGRRVVVTLEKEVTLAADQALEVHLRLA